MLYCSQVYRGAGKVLYKAVICPDSGPFYYSVICCLLHVTLSIFVDPSGRTVTTLRETCTILSSSIAWAFSKRIDVS